MWPFTFVQWAISASNRHRVTWMCLLPKVYQGNHWTRVNSNWTAHAYKWRGVHRKKPTAYWRSTPSTDTLRRTTCSRHTRSKSTRTRIRLCQKSNLNQTKHTDTGRAHATAKMNRPDLNWCAFRSTVHPIWIVCLVCMWRAWATITYGSCAHNRNEIQSRKGRAWIQFWYQSDRIHEERWGAVDVQPNARTNVAGGSSHVEAQWQHVHSTMESSHIPGQKCYLRCLLRPNSGRIARRFAPTQLQTYSHRTNSLPFPEVVLKDLPPITLNPDELGDKAAASSEHILFPLLNPQSIEQMNNISIYCFASGILLDKSWDRAHLATAGRCSWSSTWLNAW